LLGRLDERSIGLHAFADNASKSTTPVTNLKATPKGSIEQDSFSLGANDPATEWKRSGAAAGKTSL
jgi:hypothetical protein